MANPVRYLLTALKFPAQVVLEGGLITRTGHITVYPHAGANFWDRGKVGIAGGGSTNLLRAGLVNPVRLYRIHLEWTGGNPADAESVSWNTGELLWEPSRGGSGGATQWGVLDLEYEPFGLSAPQLTSSQLVFSHAGAGNLSLSWNIMYCLDNVTVAND